MGKWTTSSNSSGEGRHGQSQMRSGVVLIDCIGHEVYSAVRSLQPKKEFFFHNLCTLLAQM